MRATGMPALTKVPMSEVAEFLIGVQARTADLPPGMQLTDTWNLTLTADAFVLQHAGA
jgi:hypothetical protein